jgi:hypothetical protein
LGALPPALRAQSARRAASTAFLLVSSADATVRMGRLKPDLLITDGQGRERAVIDAKYKRLRNSAERPNGVDRGDLYQLTAYLAGHDVSYGALAYPLADDSARAADLGLGKPHRDSGLSFCACRRPRRRNTSPNFGGSQPWLSRAMTTRPSGFRNRVPTNGDLATEMNLKEIEERVAAVSAAEEPEFLFELLRAYGLPAASVTRLRNGSYNKARNDNEVLWRDKVFYRYVDGGEDIHALIDAARSDESITKQRPRFLIVRNREQIVAVDTRTSDTLDTRLTDLPGYSAFFLPWAGIEKTQIENLNLADIKAAEKMAKLYDEIVKRNAVETEDQIHDLNVFFSRLLFCFFAEDTGVFEKGSFTNAIGSLSLKGGEDVHELLDQIFDVLNTKPGKRIGFPSHLQSFGYVNGKLFERHSSAPTFSAKARSIVLECGSLDWSQINPDIFGSMMQAVVHPGQRESLGMHYTSVENIMKVIRPLFLDELQSALDVADTKAKLTRLHDRIAAIKCFDPACGSGNFLVIAYKELRKLEHRILKRLQEVDPRAPLTLFQDSKIKLENFYGIEIDDFAHEVAILSLWLAKHQMNVEFKELFGAEIRLIPLRDTGTVECANATRTDWDDVCPAHEGEEVYLLGNPPYLGSSMQSDDQKEDFVQFFGTTRYPRNLDYISLWLMKGARYVGESDATLGFVATSSVSQGDHVALMWPTILEAGAAVSFAHGPFKWSNQARGNAGVTCIVIGLSAHPPAQRRLFSGQQVRLVTNINPYLKPSHRNTIVRATGDSLFELPEMVRGSQPTDGGHLILSADEVAQLTQTYPEARQFARRYMGASELLNGQVRFCLWIRDSDAEAAGAIPPIAERRRLPRAAARGRGEVHQDHLQLLRAAQRVHLPQEPRDRLPLLPRPLHGRRPRGAGHGQEDDPAHPARRVG